MSGVLFVCVMDPVLRGNHSVLQRARLGMTTACADDLALAMRTARAARLLAPEFRRAEKLAGLKLKPEKCKAIPLSTAAQPDDKAQWSAALEVGGTGWGRFEVVPHTTYWGMQLGGTALPEVWAAVANWTHHVAEAGREAPPAVAMAIRYDTRVLPVLRYLATMFAPIPDTARLYTNAVCRMRLPGSSMAY